ncbi:MAG: alkaline phosphatase family protein [Gemmatimonadota bacterium]|nr:alkaline phosphatase family protein [Gemmatimonadota bacterium]
MTIDQMRSDYLPRFEHHLTGGLGRLIQGGAYYPYAAHDHANTETAPGHAAAWSGRFPASTTIISNDRGVPDTTVQLLDSRGPGASPVRFEGESLFDRIKARSPTARALSVSRKDRGAILAVGRAREAVYWYAPEGRFTTSTYYANALPAWVRAFNARKLPERMAGRVWTPLLPDSAYAEADGQAFEAGGQDVEFPHVMPEDSAQAARTLLEWPWMDDVTLAFALAGVEALALGTEPGMDVLAVSLSATDAVGHRYGPDSREIHDHIVRLDRMLGAFIDSLYRLRDSTGIVIALTGDHGVAPFPELHTDRTGEVTGHVSLRSQLSAVRAGLADRGVPAAAFRLETDQLWVDRAAFVAAGVSADSVVAVFADLVRAVPGVQRADLVSALATADTTHDKIARRWVHSLSPNFPIELVVTLEPYWVWGRGRDAQHGSPWDYDTFVPLVLYGVPFQPGRHPDTVRTVDLAPTLAAGLGVSFDAPTDGHVLVNSLKHRPTTDR